MQTLSQQTGLNAIEFTLHEFNTPGSVTKAVRIIWGTLAISTLFTLYLKFNNEFTAEYCVFILLMQGLACLIPYKLSCGSNTARFIYLSLVVIGTCALLGAVENLSRFGVFGLLTILGLAIWASVLLLKQETTVWMNTLFRKPEFFNLKYKNRHSKWSLYKKAVLD